MKEPRLLLFLASIFLFFTGYSQGSSTTNFNDARILTIKESVFKTDKRIKTLIGINIDTMRISSAQHFTNRIDEHSFLKYSDESVAADSILKSKTIDYIIIYSKNRKILKLTTYNGPSLSDSIKNGSLLKETPHELYFKKNALIFSRFSMSDPEAHKVQCGGAESTFLNYFINGHYFESIREIKSDNCWCGFNQVINKESIKRWIKYVYL